MKGRTDVAKWLSAAGTVLELLGLAVIVAGLWLIWPILGIIGLGSALFAVGFVLG